VIMKVTKWIALSLLVVWLPLSALAADDQGWKVNLKDADIKAFISQVANITGYSFVIDPRVKGKVTIVSDTSMGKREVYEMFQSVLNVHGFAAIPAGSVIKIVQQNNSKQEGGMPIGLRNKKSEQLITQVIQIKDTPALDLVPILRPMVAKYGHLAGVKSANALIVTDHASNVRRIEKIIERLDGSGVSELEVVQLEEAWVGDIVSILTSLDPDKVSEGGKGKSGASGVAGRIRVVADERANRLIIRGEQTARDRVKTLIATLDKPSKFSGKASVIRLQHADAKELAEMLKSLMGEVTDEKGKAKVAGKASIHADTGLNALVVRAEPSLMSEIREIVSQLDVRRAQVLIEAAIVEVTGSIDERIGVQGVMADTEDGDTPLIGTDFSDAGTSLSTLIGSIATTGVPSLSSGLTLGGVGQNGDNEFAFLIQALESVNNTNLLSTPSVMTLDNQEAEIIVGQNVPFVTGSTSSTSNSNPFTTIQREDIGTTLKVVPHVQDGKFVRLEVEQSTESVETTAVEGQADLITNKRSIKTQILAEDGEIVMLGGLIRDAVQESESKVPFLGDIPIIGWLFRSSGEIHVKQNLIVFLKPTVVLDKEKNADILRRKYDGIYEVDLSERIGDDGIDKRLHMIFGG
jgi:general secretion pathway protein D